MPTVNGSPTRTVSVERRTAVRGPPRPATSRLLRWAARRGGPGEPGRPRSLRAAERQAERRPGRADRPLTSAAPSPAGRRRRPGRPRTGAPSTEPARRRPRPCAAPRRGPPPAPPARGQAGAVLRGRRGPARRSAPVSGFRTSTRPADGSSCSAGSVRRKPTMSCRRERAARSRPKSAVPEIGEHEHERARLQHPAERAEGEADIGARSHSGRMVTRSCRRRRRRCRPRRGRWYDLDPVGEQHEADLVVVAGRGQAEQGRDLGGQVTLRAARGCRRRPSPRRRRQARRSARAPRRTV